MYVSLATERDLCAGRRAQRTDGIHLGELEFEPVYLALVERVDVEDSDVEKPVAGDAIFAL